MPPKQRKAGIVQTAKPSSTASPLPSASERYAVSTKTITASGLPSFLPNSTLSRSSSGSASSTLSTLPQQPGQNSGINEAAAIGGGVAAGSALLILTALAFCYRHTLGRWFNRVAPTPAPPVVGVVHAQEEQRGVGLNGEEEEFRKAEAATADTTTNATAATAATKLFAVEAVNTL